MPYAQDRLKPQLDVIMVSVASFSSIWTYLLTKSSKSVHGATAMNLDPNSMLRNIRLFALPTLFAAAGLFGMLFCAGHDDESTPFAAMIAGVFQIFFWSSAVVALVGIVWLIWNTWQFWRWQNGELIGGCTNCGGQMQHKNGRWSLYSRCKMCGSTRQGWH